MEGGVTRRYMERKVERSCRPLIHQSLQDQERFKAGSGLKSAHKRSAPLIRRARPFR